MAYHDPIVEQIHRIREQLLAEHGGDLRAYVTDMIRKQEEAKRRGKVYVSRPPRRPQGWIDPRELHKQRLTVQVLRVGRRRYVLLPEKQFLALLNRLEHYNDDERRDAAVVRKRLKSKQALVPLATIKKELDV